MADNTTLNSGSGGDVIATDDLATLNGGSVTGVKVQRTKVGFGSDSDFRDVDPTHQLPVIAGGNTVIASANFTRPADTTAYSINDMMANSTTAASVVPLSFTVARQNGGTFSIVRARMQTTKTGLSGNENFRLYLFQNSPTISSGDNALMSVAGRAAVFIGAFDITLQQVFNDGAKGIAGPLSGSQVVAAAAGGSQVIYGLLQALNAYTPANGETFTFELEVIQD